MPNLTAVKLQSREALNTLAASGSAALLGGAYLFQLFGYSPCAMCLWQRWPHAAAIMIGVVAFILPVRILSVFGAIAAGITAGIGVYHTGVERDWWEGPSTCTGTGALDGLSVDQLLPGSGGPALVMCDEVSWQFLSLSMASWNAALSAILVLIWLRAAFRT